MQDSLRDILTAIIAINEKFLQSLAGSGGEDLLELYHSAWDDFRQRTAGMTAPGDWQQLVVAYQEAQLNFWNSLLPPAAREASPPAGIETAAGNDPRFSDREWQENPVLRPLKQAYLLAVRSYLDMVEALSLPPAEKRKLRFYVRYLLDALAPTNFLLTNPEAIRRAVETGGESLLKGLENLAGDLRQGRLSMTDESAFTVGDNLAATPGAVIYENEVMQLLQYWPTTSRVASRPLLIIPPCINKFYILDLQRHNSFVRYCLDQGWQVFMVSWVNPDERHRHLGWDDYVEEGIIAALTAVREVAGGEKVNLLGWCIGGTLLATALAVLRARKRIREVSSVTFLTTMLDFSDPGDLGVFIDEQFLDRQEQAAAAAGFISGRDLFYSFSQVRANDLIWSYVVRNYLQGLDPAPFDILYWNSDPTNLPLKLYRFFMRNMYLGNRLVEPGGLVVGGVPVDLASLRTPAYFLAAADDHIVSWKNTYLAAGMLPGTREFVLAAGGHVAGVINPPTPQKRHFWVAGEKGEDADRWLATATRMPGSWWPHWQRWLRRRAGRMASPPAVLGGGRFQVVEPAPGSYVRRRIVFNGDKKTGTA